MNFSKIQFSFKLEDILVVLWLFTEIIFPYTSISRIVLLATVLFLFLKKGINSKLKFNLMLLFLFIIILYSIIRIPYIDNGSDHISMISTISINIIFLFVIYQYFNNSKLDKLVNVLIVGLTISLFTVLVMSLGNIVETQRIGLQYILFNENVDINSNLIGLSAMFLLFLSLYKKPNFMSFLTLFSIIIIILSGSRKALVFSAVGIIAIYIFYKDMSFKTFSKIIVFIIITAFILFNIPYINEIMGARLIELFYMLSGETTDASINTRYSLMEVGWQLFLKSPTFGYGLDSFKTFKGSYGVYSHNNYIELLVSGGLILITMYYLPIIIYIYKGIKELIKNNKFRKYGPLIMYLLLTLLIDFGKVSYYNRLDLFYILFGMAIVSLKNKYNANVSSTNKKLLYI